MTRFPTPWRAAAASVLLGLAAAGCGKKPEAKPKPPKREAVAAQAAEARQALNRISGVLRELAASPPDPETPPADRAAAMLAKLQSVPAANLPDSLRAPWQEMTAVLEAVALSKSRSLSPELGPRGEAAATALNTALAKEGLTDFRF